MAGTLLDSTPRTCNTTPAHPPRTLRADAASSTFVDGEVTYKATLDGSLSVWVVPSGGGALHRVHTLTLNGFEDNCVVYCRLLPPKSAEMDAEGCKDFRMFTVSNDENAATAANPELAAFISVPPPPTMEQSSPARPDGAELKEAQNALAEARAESASLLTTMGQLESQITGP